MNFDIDNMSIQDLSNKKVIREIFNIYTDDLELENACNKLIGRAKSFNSEELTDTVKNYILEFLEKNRRKKEAIAEKNRRLEWHLEVRRKKQAEEERRRVRNKKKELDKLELEEREKVRKLEYEEIKKNFKDALDSDSCEDLVNNRFVYNSKGELDNRSVTNYDLIMQNDNFIKEHVKFNEFTNSLEFDGRLFTNADLLNINSYLV